MALYGSEDPTYSDVIDQRIVCNTCGVQYDDFTIQGHHIVPPDENEGDA